MQTRHTGRREGMVNLSARLEACLWQWLTRSEDTYGSVQYMWKQQVYANEIPFVANRGPGEAAHSSVWIHRNVVEQGQISGDWWIRKLGDTWDC